MTELNNSTLSAKDFWDFSIAIYQQTKVQDLLLQGQEQLQANVNLSLFCLWLNQQQVALSREQLFMLHSSVNHFGVTFTKPLRTLRRSFKNQQELLTNYAQVRQYLLDAELLLEQQEQELLIAQFNTRVISDTEDKPTAWVEVIDNLETYQTILFNNNVPKSLSSHDLRDLNQYISQC